MRVIATPEARAYIAAHGGVAYVRPLRRKCCGGAMTVLSATTTLPADAGMYEPVGAADLGVRYRRPAAASARAVTPATAPVTAGWATIGSAEPPAGGTLESEPVALHAAEPVELLIELRGRRRPRLVACWDGCAFKM